MKRKSILVLATGVLFFGSGRTSFGTNASIQGLGDLGGGSFFSRAYAVSADGTVVVGYSRSAAGDEAFRWTPEVGMVGLGDLGGVDYFWSGAYGISSDGSVVVGCAQNSDDRPEAFRWRVQTGMIGLGDFDGPIFGSCAHGVSADGSVIVGYGSGLGQEAFRWTASDGLVGLGDLDGGGFWSMASAAASDGSLLVGTGHSSSGMEAFRWTMDGGMVGLGFLPGGSGLSQEWSEAHAVSEDGSVVVGTCRTHLGFEAFRWTPATGMSTLGILGTGGNTVAWDVSADGSVVVGVSGNKAFIWDTVHGMRDLAELLNNLSVDISGCGLSEATGISADGLTIVGWGSNSEWDQEAWIATVPEPSTLLLLGFGAIALRKRRT